MDFHLLKIKILYYYLDKNILSTPWSWLFLVFVLWAYMFSGRQQNNTYTYFIKTILYLWKVIRRLINKSKKQKDDDS